jgi:hypothetical protein
LLLPEVPYVVEASEEEATALLAEAPVDIGVALAAASPGALTSLVAAEVAHLPVPELLLLHFDRHVMALPLDAAPAPQAVL